jgi:hypothetical protein
MRYTQHEKKIKATWQSAEHEAEVIVLEKDTYKEIKEV